MTTWTNHLLTTINFMVQEINVLSQKLGENLCHYEFYIEIRLKQSVYEVTNEINIVLDRADSFMCLPIIFACIYGYKQVFL